MSRPSDADTGSAPGAGSQKPSPEPGDIVPVSTAAAAAGAGAGAAARAGATGSTVTSDAGCVRCSYNLVGLDTGGNCPECGHPVASSLKGFLLSNASPEYLRTLTSGVAWVLNGILAHVLLVVISVVAGFALRSATTIGQGQLTLVFSGLGLLVGLAMALGYWRYTAPDPGFTMFEQPTQARRVARAASVTGAGLALVSIPLDWLGRGTMAVPGRALLMLSAAVSVAAFVVWLVQFFSVMNYTAWIGTRVPDAVVVARARRYRWLLPVIFVVGAIVLMLGPLIALIMYWNLLDLVRKHLRSIIKSGEPASVRARLG